MIDGSHIDAYVPDESVARYQNRKGGISQNVLAICDFDMKFTYVLSGWEGSAADSTVYADARRKGLSLPHGKFFLADAGFPLCDTLLIPYRATVSYAIITGMYVQYIIHKRLIRVRIT